MKMKLSINMRVHLSGDMDFIEFAKLLMSIRDERVPLFAGPDTITIPTKLWSIVNYPDELKNLVYPNLTVDSTRPERLAKQAIISSLNTKIIKLNT